MSERIRALIIEDTPDDAALLVLELGESGYEIVSTRVDTAPGLRAALSEDTWDIVIADYSMPGLGALNALATCREYDPDLPFIVVSGTIGEERAVEMMVAGARDYVLKGNLARLGSAVRREILEAGNRRARRRAEHELQSKTFILQSILDNMSDGVVVADLAGQFIQFNPAAARMFNLGSTEGPPESWPEKYSMFLPDGRGPFPSDDVPLTRALRGESSDDVEILVNHALVPGGRLISVNARPMRDAAGRPCGGIAVFRDITAKKREHAALLRSEQRYRTLVAAMSAIVWSTPASGEFETEQRAWTAFTGHTFAEHRGWGWLEAVHPDDRVATARVWKTARATRRPYEMEHRLRRADGEFRQMSVRAVPILDEAGELREWVGVHSDVTEQRQSEAAVEVAQRRLQHVLASSPAVLFILGFHGSPSAALEWISDSVTDMLGYTPHAALGAGWWEALIHPEDRSKSALQAEELLLGRDRSTQEYRGRHSSGRYVWLRCELRLLRDASGQPLELVGSWTDVTGRKELEDQFHQAQKMEAFGQLAGGVAHDFNNHLTIINGYSEFLIQSLAPEDSRRGFAEAIHRAAARSSGLTRQLLAFSRQQVLALQVLSLNAVVTETEKMLRRLIGEDILLTTKLVSAPWPVQADPGQIEQILLNLVVNARDAMPVGGRVTIETRNVELDEGHCEGRADVRAGPHVLLSVTDSGSGMPPEVLARVFEPFFTTKRLGKGTGLGLATVYGIVKQSGGHLSVDSEVGAGTCFSVYFPRAAEKSARPELPAGSPAAPSGTETILLAEDDEEVRALTRHILTRRGYTVIEAVNGNDALAKASQHYGPIHLLVTDVVMPVAGGRVAAEGVVAMRPETRVLFVSGYTDDAVIRHGVLRDGVHYLQKPYSALALALKVREILDGE